VVKVTEIRTLTTESLKEKLNESHRELFNLRFRLATKQLTNHREINSIKKQVARIQTVMRERELQ
jgi:large subunit ribosomal protein L29